MREVDYSKFGCQGFFVHALCQLNALKNFLRDAPVDAKVFQEIASTEEAKMLQKVWIIRIGFSVVEK